MIREIQWSPDTMKMAAIHIETFNNNTKCFFFYKTTMSYSPLKVVTLKTLSQFAPAANIPDLRVTRARAVLIEQLLVVVHPDLGY